MKIKDLYSGIDLHSNNHVVAIQDLDDRRLNRKKLPNKIESTLSFLGPYKDRIQAIAVESTFNWYWLVDALKEEGYDVRLAHPGAINQYKGLKHTDDKDDAFFLAHLLRLGLLPEGYIYPKEEREVRDLNRKYRRFIQERTTHILSLKSLFNRSLSVHLSSYRIKNLKDEEVSGMIEDKNLLASAMAHVTTIRYLTHTIDRLEELILSQVKLRPEYEGLMQLPGVGKVLATSIALETGDINRFKTPGDYVSYCRCVSSYRKSNDKIKGSNNKKNGNKCLAWAYMEAAEKAKRYCPYAKAFFERKLKKGNIFIAYKALAHKYARVAYYIMKEQQEYDAKRVFPQVTVTQVKEIQIGEGEANKPKVKQKQKIEGRASKPHRGLDQKPLAPIGSTGATAIS